MLGEVPLSLQPNEWYVLVALGKTVQDRPRCFVLPRDHAAAAVWLAHRAWLHEPGIAPGKRNSTLQQSRTDVVEFAGYEERWDLLGLDTAKVPVLLRKRRAADAKRRKVALPPGHPWNRKFPEWVGFAEPE
jgi:hypothetical protein